MEKFEIFSKNKDLFLRMLEDISSAKKSIYLETFIFKEDEIGSKIRKELVKKSKEEIEVKLLLDGLGNLIKSELQFTDFISSGGEMKFFRRPLFSFFLLDRLNYRDHRKILVVDEKISYLGSSNLSEEYLGWRELNIRVDNKEIAKILKNIFLETYKVANHRILGLDKTKKVVDVADLEVVSEVPSFRNAIVRRKMTELIRQAQKSVYIESPYIAIDRGFLRLLRRAINKGIEVTVLTPANTDTELLDIINKEFLAKLHRIGVKVKLYQPGMLHSKLIIADEKFFLFGSSNLDFRSFYMQFEINLLGKNHDIGKELVNFFKGGVDNSKSFNYEEWKKRPWIIKWIGLLMRLTKYLW